MKRTRRVEITRYTLRSTVAGDETPLETSSLLDRAAFQALLDTPAAVEILVEPSTPIEPKARDVEGPDLTQRRRPLKFLKRLIKG